MNKDQVKGRVKEVAGKIQKNVGDAIDDERMEARGAMKEAEGKIQKNVGDAKRKIADHIDR